MVKKLKTELLKLLPNQISQQSRDKSYKNSLNHSEFFYFRSMKNTLFSILAKLNKLLLPSFTKRRLDLSKASKLQLLIFGWRLYVTKRALK